MTWTLFWQFVFLIAWTVFCVRVTWPHTRNDELTKAERAYEDVEL